MTKAKYSRKYIFLAIIFAFCLIFSGGIIKVSADTGDGEPVTPVYSQSEVNAMFEIGRRIDSTDITDKNLYSELLSIAQNIEVGNGMYYDEDFLYAGIFSAYDIKPATTEIIIDDVKIESLAGMELLRLESVTTLSITNCEIKTINSSILDKATNLTTLNLACNKLEYCEIDDLKKLTNVNLSGNKLSRIDLSNINSNSVDINLANNNFDDMANIKLPNRASTINLNIISNNIRNIDQTYFNTDGLTMIAGVQGLKKISNEINLDSATPFRYYKTHNSNLKVEIWQETAEQVLGKLHTTISDSNVTVGNYFEVQLPIGKYFYLYKTIDTNEDMYDEYDYTKALYTTEYFSVLPQKAKHTFEYKGESYETLDKVTGVVTVHLSAEEGADIYYSCNGSEWTKGDTVVCDKGGNYNIKVKVQKDGMDSEISSIYVKTSLNTVIPDFVMLIIVLFVALVLFLVVVPLVSKKFFKKGR